MAPNRNPHVALFWAPSGKRSRGRPRETWRRTVEKECAELGLTSWAAAAAVAKNRDRWRALISGPIPNSGQGTKHRPYSQSNPFEVILVYSPLQNFQESPENSTFDADFTQVDCPCSSGFTDIFVLR